MVIEPRIEVQYYTIDDYSFMFRPQGRGVEKVVWSNELWNIRMRKQAHTSRQRYNRELFLTCRRAEIELML